MEKYELVLNKLYSYIQGRLYQYRHESQLRDELMEDYDKAEFRTLTEIKEFIEGNLYERDQVDKD